MENIISDTEIEFCNRPKEYSISSRGDLRPIKIFCICAAYISLQFAYSVEFAIVSPIMNVDFGFPQWVYGIIWLTGPFAGFLQPLIGSLTDHSTCCLGRRRPTLIVGTIMTVITFSLLLNINKLLLPLNILWLRIIIMFIIMLATNISINCIQVPIRSLVADIVPKHQQEYATRLGALLMHISACITNLVGGVRFFTNWDFDTELFLFFAGIIVIPIFCTITCIFAKEKKITEKVLNDVSQFSLIFQKIKHIRKPILKIAILYMISWMALYPAESLLTDHFGIIYGMKGPKSEYFRNYHHGQALGMFALSLSNFIVIPISFIQAKIRAKMGVRLTYASAQLVLCMILTTVFTTKNGYVLLGFFSLLESTKLFFISFPFEMIHNYCYTEENGTYVGIMNIFCVTGQTLTNFICTTGFGSIKIKSFPSTSMPIAAGSIFSLFAAIGSYFLDEPKDKTHIDDTISDKPLM